jgi:outer membrane protein assembly factor BamA
MGRTGVRFNIDQRNDLSWPTSGYTLNSELATARYGLGGDLRYEHWEVSTGLYHELPFKGVFALHLALSAYDDVERRSDIDQNILPASERLYSGGAESVRGFRERSLGPRVAYHTGGTSGRSTSGVMEHVVFGGSRSTLVKAELRRQIIPQTLAVTVFTDSGNTFLSQKEEDLIRGIYHDDANGARLEDNRSYEFSEIVTDPSVLWTKNYLSYGTALNYLTPLGSINLAYGLPWREPEGTTKRGKQGGYPFTRGEFHINMGATF